LGYFAQLDRVSQRKPDELAADARRILEQQSAIPPRVRFEKMVEEGLIDRQGRLTKNFGGDAEPVASAPTKARR
jgi:hypothetical protein